MTSYLLSFIFMIRGDPISWLFYFMTLIPYAGFLIFLHIFLTCKHTLVIASDGLFYEELVKRLGVNFLPWEEVIRATESRCPRSGSYVNIELREGCFLDEIKKNSKTHKHLMGNSICLWVGTLSCNMDKNGLSLLSIRWKIFLSVLNMHPRAVIICADINKAVGDSKNQYFTKN